ncbi:MAG TPA: glycosyltransferase family 39 protein [Gaiellaceae bacterium]|nr:glycosyltransferase family 39 protein [Gaiellaceae bacterium]
MRPWPLLLALAALQLALALWFGFKTPHNGWIWYSGGDATEYWAEQWSMAHLSIPQAVIGPGLPVYYAWVPLVAGATLLQGAAVIVLLQAIVLVPLAFILFWLIADRLFGRVYAWACALLWIAGPFLLIHGFVSRYRPAFDQQFLVPHWFGFTNMADLPSLVAVLASAWLLLRAVDLQSRTDAVLAGLAWGIALMLKPSNGFFVIAVAVLFLATRQWRQAAHFAVALVPALLVLLLWKLRGLGTIPITSSSYQHVRLAAGIDPTLAVGTSKYGGFNWSHLQQEIIQLREFFWSMRFLEFLLFAGAFGVIRRRPTRGLFVVSWFAAYGMIKGSNTQANFDTTSWFRLSEPGLPAYILLAVGVVYCLPVLGRRATELAAPAVERLDVRRIAVSAAFAAAIPVLVMVIAQPASSMRIARDNSTVNEAPLSDAFDLRAHRHGDKLTLTWRRPPHGTTTPLFALYYAGRNNGCEEPEQGARECRLDMTTFKRVRKTSITVPHAKGTYWFRVGMVANYKLSTGSGDLMLLSRAVRVR